MIALAGNKADLAARRVVEYEVCFNLKNLDLKGIVLDLFYIFPRRISLMFFICLNEFYEDLHSCKLFFTSFRTY